MNPLLTPEQHAHVLAVADAIEEAGDEGFDQSMFKDDCGTGCCVAGHSGVLDGDPYPDADTHDPWLRRRAAALGVYLPPNSVDVFPALFKEAWPEDWFGAEVDPNNRAFDHPGLVYPTAEEAAAILRRFAAGNLDVDGDEP